MNCDQTQQRLDDYLDGDLAAEDQTAVTDHLDYCRACQRSLSRLRDLRAELRALPVPPTRPEFARDALQRARMHHAGSQRPVSRQRHWFMAGFATAAAAGLALWAVVLVFAPNAGQTELPRVAVTTQQTRTVQLVFNAPRDLEGVTLSMQLPEHFELAGYPGRQQLTWETNLRKGRNVLALPVRARSSGRGELIANMQHEGGAKTFRVRLDASASPTSRRPVQQMIVG